MERNPAADLWRNTLSQIPTLFGRLQYLASLRDSNTGEYRHFGLAQRFGDEGAGHAIHQSHLDLFGDWLGYDLARQKKDLEEYLDGLEGNKKAIIESWARLKPFANCMPADIREVERELYLSDVEALLEMLRYEYGVVLPDPNA